MQQLIGRDTRRESEKKNKWTKAGQEEGSLEKETPPEKKKKGKHQESYTAIKMNVLERHVSKT